MSNILKFNRRGHEDTPAAQELNSAADFTNIPDVQDYKLLDSMLESINHKLLSSENPKDSQLLTQYVVSFLNEHPELAAEVQKGWVEFVNDPDVQTLLAEAINHALPFAPEYQKLLEGASPKSQFTTFEKMFIQLHYRMPPEKINTILTDLRKGLLATLPMGVFLNTFLDLSDSHDTVKALKNKHLLFVLRRMAYGLSDKPIVQRQFVRYAAQAFGGFRVSEEVMKAA